MRINLTSILTSLITGPDVCHVFELKDNLTGSTGENLIFGEHLMKTQIVIGVPGAHVGNHCVN